MVKVSYIGSDLDLDPDPQFCFGGMKYSFLFTVR